MDDLISLLFLVNITLLNAHELDAIQQHEWRFFPFLRPFSDVTAYRIFVAAHVPLMVLILANAESRSFQIGLDIFLIVHAGLHYVLRNHPLVTFNNGFSRLWIYGAAVLSVVHLLLLLTSG